IRLFFAFTANKKLITTLLLLFSLPFLYFTYISPYTDARIFIVSLMFAVCSLISIQAIRSSQPISFSLGARLLQAVLVLMVLLMCYRIVHLLFIGALGSVFSKNMLNVAVAGLSYFVVYGMT
ncbi:hypothetical protein DVW31_15615, partial [Enterococcus faecium]|uniref:hypothetical protein n=1 Tax=Enterococcus faecium TaxID=1352 RepID=UPI0011338EC5